ncbi:hypothetical protein VTO73DRAFT_6426 [Trametes versicolor]
MVPSFLCGNLLGVVVLRSGRGSLRAPFLVRAREHRASGESTSRVSFLIGHCRRTYRLHHPLLVGPAFQLQYSS